MRLVALLTIAFTAVSFAQSSCQTRNDCSGDQVCAGTFSFLPTPSTCSLPWPAPQIFQIFSSHTTNMLLRPACPAQESLEMFCVEPTDSICAGKGNCEGGGACDVCGNLGDFFESLHLARGVNYNGCWVARKGGHRELPGSRKHLCCCLFLVIGDLLSV